jgi:hypothetical protein
MLPSKLQKIALSLKYNVLKKRRAIRCKIPEEFYGVFTKLIAFIYKIDPSIEQIKSKRAIFLKFLCFSTSRKALHRAAIYLLAAHFSKCHAVFFKLFAQFSLMQTGGFWIQSTGIGY